MSANAGASRDLSGLTQEMGVLTDAIMRRYTMVYPLLYNAAVLSQYPTQHNWDLYSRLYDEKKEALREYDSLIALKETLKLVMAPVWDLKGNEESRIPIPRLREPVPPPRTTSLLNPPRTTSLLNPPQERPPVVYQMVNDETLPTRKRLREVSPPASSSTDGEREEREDATMAAKKQKTTQKCSCCGEPNVRVTTCGRTSVHPCLHTERCVNRPKA
jgi:hypothetical protein